MGLAENCIGIKAKTPEGMGTDNAAIAHATVLLTAAKKKTANKKKKTR
jgi:2C-methyl-D-erythritol 2,4-cyclodiphosphate synthase